MLQFKKIARQSQEKQAQRFWSVMRCVFSNADCSHNAFAISIGF
jgi:hypothetical protein